MVPAKIVTTVDTLLKRPTLVASNLPNAYVESKDVIKDENTPRYIIAQTKAGSENGSK